MIKRITIAVLVIAAGGIATGWMLFGRTAMPPPEAEHTTILDLSGKSATEKKAAATQPRLAISGQEAIATPEFLDGVSRLSARDSAGAISIRNSMNRGSDERLALSWAIAVSGQSAIPASEYRSALAELANWPGRSDIEENLEIALYEQKASAADVIAALSGINVKTPRGAIALFGALELTGDTGQATTLARHFWRSAKMQPAEEDLFLARFSAMLKTEDYLARMSWLLFAEKYGQAQRFAKLAGAETLWDAFVAVARKQPDAGSKIKAVEPKWQSSPVFLYLATRQLRLKRHYDDAARLLAQMPRDRESLVSPSEWWVEARIVSRGLFDQGKARAAYTLAASHAAEKAEDIAEAEFHAGWYALRGLKDAKTARKHFANILKASERAHDQARGLYWLGRAAELDSVNRPEDWYRKASSFPTTFYGQMALAKTGQPLVARALPEPGDFENRPFVKAISFLEQAGENGRARRLYLALAGSLENARELQLLADRALKKHGPTLALAIGKTAQNAGHDPGWAAYPLGAIPDNADVSGPGKALAYAIARQESAFDPSAISAADARGLLQILPATAKNVAKRYQIAWVEEKLIDDPAYNATLGSRYLGEQLSTFNGSYILTFAAYNAGPNRIPQWIRRYGDPRGKSVEKVVDWIENIPFSETRDYVQRVMENYQIYKVLLGETADLAEDLRAGGP